jgi:hypothetical protein
MGVAVVAGVGLAAGGGVFVALRSITMGCMSVPPVRQERMRVTSARRQGVRFFEVFIFLFLLKS